MLLDVPTINRRVERTLGFMGFLAPRLRPSPVSEGRVAEIEQHLGVVFPPSFRASLLRFDLTRLALGAVIFEYGDGYRRLEQWNLPDAEPWWGRRKRPAGTLSIGSTTGYGLLLDLVTEAVFAYDYGVGPLDRHAAACQFEPFVLAAATVLVQEKMPDPDAYAAALASELGIPPAAFWRDVVRGWA